MGKDRLLPIFALLILIIASTSSIYVYATQTTTETLLVNGQYYTIDHLFSCLLYTSDAADEEDSVDLGGRRIIKKKN